MAFRGFPIHNCYLSVLLPHVHFLSKDLDLVQIFVETSGAIAILVLERSPDLVVVTDL